MDGIPSFPHENAAANENAVTRPHRDLASRLPPWLRSRWAVVLAVFALVGLGLALGWPWLVAFGLAPLVLSLLPCVVMCALGLCIMGGKDGGSCRSQQPGGASGLEARSSRHDAA